MCLRLVCHVLVFQHFLAVLILFHFSLPSLKLSSLGMALYHPDKLHTACTSPQSTHTYLFCNGSNSLRNKEILDTAAISWKASIPIVTYPGLLLSLAQSCKLLIKLYWIGPPWHRLSQDTPTSWLAANTNTSPPVQVVGQEKRTDGDECQGIKAQYIVVCSNQDQPSKMNEISNLLSLTVAAAVAS